MKYWYLALSLTLTTVPAIAVEPVPADPDPIATPLTDDLMCMLHPQVCKIK